MPYFLSLFLTFARHMTTAAISASMSNPNGVWLYNTVGNSVASGVQVGVGVGVNDGVIVGVTVVIVPVPLV